tara:strand:- start:21 stop:293 length:273 start_codon:yes stop_codon:yes gene_type:complete
LALSSTEAFANSNSIQMYPSSAVKQSLPGGVTFEIVKIFADGNDVFTIVTSKGDGVEISVGHHQVVIDGKVKEMHIFDYSHIWAMTLKQM